MNIGERIKKKRKELKISADKLGEIIGKNRATIYRYENNEIENMPYEVIEPIAKALNVSPVYLMGWTDNMESLTSSQYPYLPATISAGLPIDVEGITEADKISIPDLIMGKWAGNDNLLIMRINGESMNKIIPDNSLIVVNMLNEYSIHFGGISDGDIVVYSDDNDYAVKRFYRDNEKLIFRPESNDPYFYDYITDTSNENLRIRGKVVLYIVEHN